MPANVAPDLRRKLEAALDAWQRTLDLSFELRELSGVGIEIRLFDDMLAYEANTVADCAIDAEALAAGTPDVLPARLVFASIQMARDDPRLAGTTLHELGHALGLNHSVDKAHLMIGGVAPFVDNFAPVEISVIRARFHIPRGLTISCYVRE